MKLFLTKCLASSRVPFSSGIKIGEVPPPASHSIAFPHTSLKISARAWTKCETSSQAARCFCAALPPAVTYRSS